MNQNEIVIPRKLVYRAAIGIAILGVLVFSLIVVDRLQKPAASPALPAGSPEKFALLSGQSGQRSVGST